MNRVVHVAWLVVLGHCCSCRSPTAHSSTETTYSMEEASAYSNATRLLIGGSNEILSPNEDSHSDLCDQGDAYACMLLGRDFFAEATGRRHGSRKGPSDNASIRELYEAGLYYLRKACDAGLGEACYLLVDMANREQTRSAIGVPSDLVAWGPQEDLKLLEKGCGGAWPDGNACYQLALVYNHQNPPTYLIGNVDTGLRIGEALSIEARPDLYLQYLDRGCAEIVTGTPCCATLAGLFRSGADWGGGVSIAPDDKLMTFYQGADVVAQERKSLFGKERRAIISDLARESRIGAAEQSAEKEQDRQETVEAIRALGESLRGGGH